MKDQENQNQNESLGSGDIPKEFARFSERMEDEDKETILAVMHFLNESIGVAMEFVLGEKQASKFGFLFCLTDLASEGEHSNWIMNIPVGDAPKARLRAVKKYYETLLKEAEENAG